MNINMQEKTSCCKGLKRPCRLFLLFIFHILLFHSFVACDDYDSFTTDRSAMLIFNRDSIVFDTLITTVPSSTQTLIVYNPGGKGLRINQVHLETGAASPFRINIDGQDMSRSVANLVTDFEVRRRDSIVVRAEVTLPTLNSDDPQAFDDALVFTLESGVQQRIPLKAVGLDAFFLRGRVLTSDTTFSNRRPNVIYDSLVVAKDAVLTLPAGTQLYFHNKAGLTVHGRLVATGTLEAPVVFRGDRTDHMFAYLPYDRLPSRWEGIQLMPESYDNVLDYIDLHSGCYGIHCDSAGVERTKLILTNSRIHNLGGHGLSLLDCKVGVANTEISNTLGHCVWLCGGDVSFVHCTLAQFYALSYLRGDALNISNILGEDPHPLYRGDFINCVLTGYEDDVLMGSWAEGEEFEANYHFLNSFIATEVTDMPDRFVGIVYDLPESPIRHEYNFRLVDSYNYLYDFTPIAVSGIRDIGAPEYTELWPLDRLGRSRLADEKPDAGCYEFIPEE